MPSISQINDGVVMTGFQQASLKKQSESEHFQNGIRSHKRTIDIGDSLPKADNQNILTSNGHSTNGNGIHHNGINGNGVNHDDIDSVNGNGVFHSHTNGNGLVVEKFEEVSQSLLS